VSLDEARRRLVEGEGAPFAALTFDDGYRDTLDEALPVLERQRAPFTLYCATGFIERTARLWWLELEEAIRRLETLDIGTARLAVADAGGEIGCLRPDLLAAARAFRAGAYGDCREPRAPRGRRQPSALGRAFHGLERSRPAQPPPARDHWRP